MDDRKGQQDIAAKKLQETAVRGGRNLATGGNYEKIRNTSTGNAAKRMEDVASNKLNNITSKTPLNKPTGGVNKNAVNGSSLGSKISKNPDIAKQKLLNVKNSKSGRLNRLLRRGGSSNETSSDTVDEENIDDEDTTADEVIARKSLIRLLVSISSMFIPLLLFIPIILILIVVIIIPSNFFKPLLSVFEYENTGNKDYYLVIIGGN